MSAPTLWDTTKKQVKFFFGFGDECQPPKPSQPLKPVGKLRVCNNYVKLVGLLALCGYFLYLLVSLIANYLEDVANPPLKVNQALPKGRDEPFFPAVVFCNTGYNGTIDLLQVGFQEKGNASSDLYCFPESGDDNCEAGFPKEQLQFWKFSIRHDDPSDSRRRRRLTTTAAIQSMRNKMDITKRNRELQEEEEDVLPSTNGAYDVHCIAMDASAMPGFVPRREPRSKELILLFAYDQAPGDIELVQTAGLRGLDVFFFNTAQNLPGFAHQDPEENFEGLYDDPDLISVDRFFETSGEGYVLGQNALIYMTITQSQYRDGNSNVTFQYNARSMTAELNSDNFQSGFNPEVSNPNDTTQLSLMVLSYETPLVTFYTRSPPGFAEFLGSIGGLKSILFDFWAILLSVLVSINQMSALAKKNNTTKARAAVATDVNADVNVDKKGGAVAVAATTDDDA